MKDFLISWTTNDCHSSSEIRGTVAKLGSSVNCLPNVMILRHPGSAQYVRKKLLPILRPEDGLLVAELTGNYAWGGEGCAMTN